MIATRAKRRTAAPPIAMPAMAPGERGEDDEVVEGEEGEEEGEEVAVGEMVVNWNAVGVAEGEPEDAAPGIPEAERLTYAAQSAFGKARGQVGS